MAQNAQNQNQYLSREEYVAIGYQVQSNPNISPARKQQYYDQTRAYYKGQGPAPVVPYEYYVAEGYAIRDNPNIPEAEKQRYYDETKAYALQERAARVVQSQEFQSALPIQQITTVAAMPEGSLTAQQRGNILNAIKTNMLATPTYRSPLTPMGASQTATVKLQNIRAQVEARRTERLETQNQALRVTGGLSNLEVAQQNALNYEKTFTPTNKQGTYTPQTLQQITSTSATIPAGLTPEEKTAYQEWNRERSITPVKNLGLFLGSFVLAPVLGPVGTLEAAGVGVGATQVIKLAKGGGILTPQELYEGATGGIVFGGTSKLAFTGLSLTGKVGAQLAGTQPVSSTVGKIAAAGGRVAVNTGIGAGGGYVLSGGDPEAALQGAEFGAVFGVGSEVIGVGGKVVREKATDKLSESYGKTLETGEIWKPTTSERVLMKTTGAQPNNAAVRNQANLILEESYVTTSKANTNRLMTETAMDAIDKPVQPWSPTPKQQEMMRLTGASVRSSAEGRVSAVGYPSGAKTSPYTLESRFTAEDAFDFALAPKSSMYTVYKQPVETVKAPATRNMPTYFAARGSFVDMKEFYDAQNKFAIKEPIPKEEGLPESFLDYEYHEPLSFRKTPLPTLTEAASKQPKIPRNTQLDRAVLDAQRFTVPDDFPENSYVQKTQMAQEYKVPSYGEGYSVEIGSQRSSMSGVAKQRQSKITEQFEYSTFLSYPEIAPQKIKGATQNYRYHEPNLQVTIPKLNLNLPIDLQPSKGFLSGEKNKTNILTDVGLVWRQRQPVFQVPTETPITTPTVGAIEIPVDVPIQNIDLPTIQVPDMPSPQKPNPPPSSYDQIRVPPSVIKPLSMGGDYRQIFDFPTPTRKRRSKGIFEFPIADPGKLLKEMGF